VSKKILILATHPDDECLAFAGLMSISKRLGDQVHVHYFCVGGPTSNVSEGVRLSECLAIQNFFGNTMSYDLGLDGLLDTKPNCEITNQIDQMIDEYQPDELYCSPVSEHSDHKALYAAFLGSCRLKTGFMPKLIAMGVYPNFDQLYQEPTGGKIFQPLTEEDFNNKIEAFKLYKSQYRESPSTLNLDGLRIQAEYNGMLCGCKYAELYYQLRYIRSVK